MGTYLSTPVLDKCWQEGEDLNNSKPVAWGVVDMQGWRKSMEDAHIAQTNVRSPSYNDNNDNNNTTNPNDKPNDAQIYAVFDGHGGAEVARFCQLYLIDVLTRRGEWNGKDTTSVDVGQALINCFHDIDILLDDPTQREEINLLRMNKPDYSERRTLLIDDTPHSESTEKESEDEEKKMEETSTDTSTNSSGNGSDNGSGSGSPTDSTAETEEVAENNSNSKEFESDDSAASDDVVVDANEKFDDDDSDDDGDNDTGDETTIDITAADSLSLFKKLLTISKKAGGPSGTVPLGGGGGGESSGETQTEGNKIIPTILQNGRPVCNLPDHPIHAGCTSVCAVISDNTLTVANAGDSRVVLCRAEGVTEPMSYDHKPMHDIEMQRITQAGGFVNQFGRVNGNLNLSRSIGDLKYKQVPDISPAGQMITAEPDIKQVTLRDDDEFIILACDGIWDCLTNEEAVKFVRDRINTSTPTEIGVEMLDEIVSKDPRETQGIGGDNMTVMVVDLMPQSRPYRQTQNSETDTETTQA